MTKLFQISVWCILKIISNDLEWFMLKLNTLQMRVTTGMINLENRID